LKAGINNQQAFYIWIPDKSYRIFRNAIATTKAFLRKQESSYNPLLPQICNLWQEACQPQKA
jgi:hypothetical protein